MKLRKSALILHRFMGVMVGILLVVIGLTGSTLVFWKEIHHARNIQLMQVVPQGERVSLDSIIEPIRLAYPDFKLGSVRLPQKPEETYEVGMKSKDDQWTDIYVNPYTREILGSLQWEHTLMGFVYTLHFKLLAGDVGEKVVGICGILLLLLGVSGLILWSGWRRFAQGFKIRWNSPPQLISYDIHKLVGILSAGFLILIATTGAGMIFHTETEQALYWLTRTPKPIIPTSTLVSGQLPITLDEVLRTADAALPGANTTYISLPAQPDGVFRILKKFPQEVVDSGRNRIYLDQYNGNILLVENAFKVPVVTHIMNSLFPLHMGAYGGLGMRLLYLLIGLTPSALFITGMVMWRQRQWAKARRQEAIRQSQHKEVF